MKLGVSKDLALQAGQVEKTLGERGVSRFEDSFYN